jgi:hypothetical protein
MSKENIGKIISDKNKARDLAEKLYEEIAGENPGLNKKAYQNLLEHFSFMRMYVRAFRLSARGYCFARYAVEVDKNGILAEGKNAATLLLEVIRDLEEYAKELSGCSFLSKYPFDAQLNPERVDYFIKNLKGIAVKNKLS